MSYVLWKGPPINMSRGTISIWFRVPKASAEEIGHKKAFGELAPLQNMIPILAFSEQHDGPWTEFTFPVINTFYYPTNSSPPFNYQPVPYYGSIPGPTWALPYWPCVIGVYVDKDMKGTLAVVLQPRDVGVPVNTNSALVSATGTVGTSGDAAGKLFGPTSLTYANASGADARMEWFEHNYESGPEVTFDAWHHVLLSWDLQGSNSSFGHVYSATNFNEKPFHEYFTARSKMYCAFDDKNLTGYKLPTQYWTNGFGPNEIVCYTCWRLGGAPYRSDAKDYFGFPTYTVTFEQGIRMDAVAVPSEPKYKRWLGDTASPATEEVDAIIKVEVAELQIFSDLLLDTSKEINRRAFIDLPKADATPSPDEDRVRMAPVDPKETEKKLGQRPDILLHTTGNWKKGRNTGKIGFNRELEGEDRIILAGQFKPTGKITPWKPDPTLLAEKGKPDEGSGGP